MSLVNIIILIVAAVAILTILGVRPGPRGDDVHRDVVRRDENDDA